MRMFSIHVVGISSSVVAGELGGATLPPHSFIHFFIATNVKRIRRYIGYD